METPIFQKKKIINDVFIPFKKTLKKIITALYAQNRKIRKWLWHRINPIYDFYFIKFSSDLLFFFFLLASFADLNDSFLLFLYTVYNKKKSEHADRISKPFPTI